MSGEQPNNPLHGVTLEAMLKHLVRELGWEEMARRVEIRCFMFEPTLTSSLRFLRRTPWARQKVEEMYLDTRPGAR
jgi:uncharacterized protein (DUF2132 family)